MFDEIINLQYTTIKDPVPDFIYEGLKQYSSGANSYKPQPQELIEKLAKIHNLPKEMIYLTAGCDEAIQMFIHAYGKKTYTFTPTYIVYSDAKEFGKEFNEVFSIKNETFEVTTNKIDKATLIFLANPNNPSGFTSKEKVLELIRNNPHSKVVIDEAYGDFAGLSIIDQIKNYPYAVVLKSFSKGYGIAGNRVGYIIANPEIISVVKNKAQWSNVSYLSVGAAMTVLDHKDYFKKMREDIAKRREDFMAFLKKNNYYFLPSKINAVVLKFKDKKDGTRFFEYLKNNNIITSHGNGFSNIGLDDSFVRIAIGNSVQMKVVGEVIRKFKRRAD